ncbi:histidine kinase [Actinoplanes sp. NPDC026619]|uniref:histidine kinase n=1 Tax=Actinoplanes sp. NPDC026619 TaxID=3155798 RepID=UPI0033FF5C37
MTLDTYNSTGSARRRADEHWSRRRDLERQLHDGPALRIAALALRLGLLAQKARHDIGGLPHDIEELQNQLHLIQQELRAVADRIYPPLLHEAGLGPALCELASSASLRVDAGGGRFDPAVEGVAYFAILGVLAAPPPATRTVDVVIRRDPDGLALVLGNVDTGQIGSVRDRVQWVGGVAETGGGLIGTITVRIPCE